MADSTITRMPEWAAENVANFQAKSPYVPVVIDGANKKYNLSNLILLLRPYIKSQILDILAEMDILSGYGSQQGGSLQGESLNLSELLTAVQELLAYKAHLTSPSTWPIHYITVVDGLGHSYSLAFPTGPDNYAVLDGQFRITTNSIDLPDFFVTTSISDRIDILLDRKILIGINILVSNETLNILLRAAGGEAIGNIRADVKVTLSDGSILEFYAATDSDRLFSTSLTDSLPWPLHPTSSVSIAEGLTITRIDATAKIRNITVGDPAWATYSNGNWTKQSSSGTVRFTQSGS